MNQKILMYIFNMEDQQVIDRYTVDDLFQENKNKNKINMILNLIFSKDRHERHCLRSGLVN